MSETPKGPFIALTATRFPGVQFENWKGQVVIIYGVHQTEQDMKWVAKELNELWAVQSARVAELEAAIRKCLDAHHADERGEFHDEVEQEEPPAKGEGGDG